MPGDDLAIERSILALGEMMKKEKKEFDVLLPDPRIPKHSCSIFFLTGAPYSGKTSTAELLIRERPSLIHIVPEDVMRKLLEEGSDDVREYVQSRIAKDPQGKVPEKLLFRILKIEISKHLFGAYGSDRFLIEGLPTSMEQYNKFKAAFGVVRVIVLNMHPDLVERRAMADPMTFNEGDRRLAVVREKKEAWAELWAFMETPEFREQSTWVDASGPLEDVAWYIRDVIDAAVKQGPAKTPSRIGRIAQAITKPFRR
ncbi:hypothetical protein BJX96DRAFT_170615 [Aspergillus floccosus]